MGEAILKVPDGGNQERSRRWRAGLLLIAGLFSFLAGLGSIGQPVEDMLRVSRNAATQRAASGDIVIAAIDDRSLQE